MSQPIVTAAPNRVFLRCDGLVLELTPVGARKAAHLLLEAANTAASTYDGCWLAEQIRNSQRPDA